MALGERFQHAISGLFISRERGEQIVQEGGIVRRLLTDGRKILDIQTITGGRVVQTRDANGEILDESSPGFFSFPAYPPNWSVDDESKWGVTWWAPGRGEFGEGMDLRALAGAHPEPGMRSFRVRYMVPGNPMYPRGFSSTDFLTIDGGTWPPGLDHAIGATGIAAIHWQGRYHG